MYCDYFMIFNAFTPLVLMAKQGIEYIGYWLFSVSIEISWNGMAHDALHVTLFINRYVTTIVNENESWLTF